MPSDAPELIRLENVTKYFGPTRALDGVSFSIRAGRIHALVGENGAGKSTLIKIIAGIWPHGTYSGKVYCSGEEARFSGVFDAKRAKIAVIHQELALVPDMTVAENILLGNEPQRAGLIDRKSLLEKSRRMLGKLKLSIDPERRVAELGTGERQLVEIAKALAADFRILVLDEPTASLSEAETDRLLEFLKELKERGIGIIYISHRLKEVLRIADDITVLRDGKSAASLAPEHTDEREIIQSMVGRRIEQVFPLREVPPAAEKLRIADWAAQTRSGTHRPISFSVRKKEIVGLAGLVGAGRTEFLESIFGLRRPVSGTLFLDGKPVQIRSVRHAMSLGFGFVTEDRKATGLVLDQSIESNVTLASLEDFSTLGWIRRKTERSAAERIAYGLRIKSAGMAEPAASLSGGNQQKVVLAKWLLRAPQVLLLDEPTRGIDVGAKSEIYHLIRKIANEGVAVILVSSELTELLGLADRIVVFHEGGMAGAVDAAEASEEALMHAMTGASL